MLNNHNYHGNDEPRECPECNSAMTEHVNNLLECDECPHTEFKGEE